MDVRVIVPDVGGGFGPKGGIYPEEILVAAAALRLGRAVKWVETRREDLMSTGQDREQVHDVTIGFRRDGTIVGIDATFPFGAEIRTAGARPVSRDICGPALAEKGHEYIEVADVPGWREYEFPELKGSG